MVQLTRLSALKPVVQPKGEVQMRRTVALAILLLLAIAGGVSAQIHGQGDVAEHQACQFCGMDRHKFAHSAMLVEYEDGTMVAACSIHCAAIDLATNIDKTPRTVQVGDYNTRLPINAETACWAVGGDVPGVMTKRAKWAFADKSDCETFAKAHGAELVSFDDAMKAAYEDMYSDTKMIRDKRKAMRNQQHQQEQKQ
jgi:nitrous oxide reductase accessory protein NosL